MKSLIIKDLYNIGHNAKSMIFSIAVFAFAFIPSGGSGFTYACAALFCMMIVTTFAFDDNSKWTRYAMIMPVSKKELVAGKFIVLAIFCMIGSLLGLVIGSAGGIIIKKIPLNSDGIGEALFSALAAWAISLIFGSISIPFIFRFGAEKARGILFVSFLIPTAVIFGIYKLLKAAGVVLTEQLVIVFICCLPVIALIWCWIMYRISYRIFDNQDL